MNMERDCDPRLVVVSGPSGVGKTTVVRRLYELCSLPLVAGVSATTRPPRPGEVDGVDYYFLEADDFQRRRENGDFIECFDVFGRGYWYGTLKSEVNRALEKGNWVVLEIDVQGAAQVMQLYASAITIFVLPGSEEELERRLRGRATESEEAVLRRLQQAKQELQLADRYRHQVVNDVVDRAAREICDILNREVEGNRNAR
jgi:guanylate kinase